MSRDSPTARLFAAVDPSPAVRQELSSWAREAAGAMRAEAGLDTDVAATKVRVPAPDTLHVTLCFLGSRPVEELDTLAAALDIASDHGGELSLGAPLWLPPRDPRSLALEVHEHPAGWLVGLQRALSAAFASVVDWQPERRRFRPHLTAARLGRSGKPSRRARRGGHATAAPLPPTPQLAFAPTEVVLYRSWLDPQGASYEAIATRTLSAASPSSSPSSPVGEEGDEPFVP